MVRIRMKSFGRRHRPFFRICAMDSRTGRDGRAIEELGHYDPMVRNTEARTVLNASRIRYWLSVGAQPSEAVQRILEKTGDWQQFKGLDAPAPMKVAAPKADRKAVFEAAAKEAADEPKVGATTPKKKAEKAEKAEKKADETPATEAPVETPAPAVEAEIASEG